MFAKKNLLLLFATSAMAGTLTLNDAINRTLLNHPNTHIASLHYENTLAEIKNLDAARYPKVDLNGGYYPTKTYVMPAQGIFSTKQHDGFHTDVTAVYSLWDAGRMNIKTTAALSAKEGAKSTQKLTQSELIEQVWLRYYGVAYAKRVIDSAESSVKLYESLYTQAINMRKNGLKTEADELRFNASRMEARDRLIWAKSEYDKACVALGLLVGSNEPIDVEKFLLEERSDGIDVRMMDIESLHQALRDTNPRLKILQSAIVQTKALSEVSEAEHYGEVAVVAGASYDNSLSSYDSYHAGIVGTIPLYDGGKLSAQSQKSRIEYTLVLRELENTERILWQELYGAYRDTLRADETIKAKREVVQATQKALLLLQERYKQGLATYIDILEAQKTLDAAHLGVADGQYQKIRSFVLIEKLLDKGCDNHGC